MKVQVSIKALIKESFALFKENILILLGLIFGGIVVSLLLSIPTTFQIGGLAGALVSTLLRVIFQTVFSAMLIKYCLLAIKGYDPGFKEITPYVSQCLKIIGYSLLSTLSAIPLFLILVFAGFTLTSFQVPSTGTLVTMFVYILFLIYVLVFRLWAVPFLIMDKNYGLFKSIKESWIITNGNGLSMLSFILISLLLYIVGIIALLIGVFVAIAFCFLLLTLYYSKIALQLNDGDEAILSEE